MSTLATVRNHIKHYPLGHPFTTTSLASLASRANLDQILSRLAKSGEIKRVARGIFICPEYIPHLGTVFPEPFEIAKAIAHTTGETITVQGAEAARILHLTTQVPLKPIFYTTGTTRHIKLGKLEILLKHVSPRKIVKPGTLVCLAISALWYLGKENVTIQIIEKLSKQLTKEQFANLIESIPQMPGWMANVFYRYQQEHPNE